MSSKTAQQQDTRGRKARAGRGGALFPFARHTPVLVVPGLRDAGPRHWQSLWLLQHAEFARVAPPGVDAPSLDAWSDAVAHAIDAVPAPPIVVAHSFGCLATIHAALVHRRVLAGAFLVAPADPDRHDGAEALPAGPLAFPSTVAASTDDPWLKFVKAGALASRWGSRFVAFRNAGHINAESGHGEWPAGYALLRDLAEKAAATRAARN